MQMLMERGAEFHSMNIPEEVPKEPEEVPKEEIGTPHNEATHNGNAAIYSWREMKISLFLFL